MGSYATTVVAHFAILATIVALAANASKIWDGIPWWGYAILLIAAPITASGKHGFSAIPRAIVYWRRSKLRFPDGTVVLLGRGIKDLLESVRTGRAGFMITSQTQSKQTSEWVSRVLATLLEVLRKTSELPEDTYLAWLKSDESLFHLEAVAAHNAVPTYFQDHTKFAKGEGLAGKVWESGESATHSRRRPNKSWRVQPNCKNESYVCVAVGVKGGKGGVLGLGSDTGFTVTKAQEELLEMFAALLDLATDCPLEQQVTPLHQSKASP